jgi:hypothetical protein
MGVKEAKTQRTESEFLLQVQMSIWRWKMERQTQHIMFQVSSLIQVGEQELEVEGERYKYGISSKSC